MIAEDSRLHLSDKLAAAAHERVTKKARGSKGEEQILPKGAHACCLQVWHCLTVADAT